METNKFCIVFGALVAVAALFCLFAWVDNAFFGNKKVAARFLAATVGLALASAGLIALA